MIIHCNDQQNVGETESQLFESFQQGSVDALFILLNPGSNTINSRFQEFDGADWVDLSAQSTDMNNTLQAGYVRSIAVKSTYPRVRLYGNASGTSVLDFSIMRYFPRTTGGAIPVLSL